MSRYTRRHLTMTLKDGAGHSWSVGPTPGDLTINGMEEGGLEALETMDGGDYDGFVYGDQKLTEWTITVELPNAALTSLVADTIQDWINKTGKVAAYTSVDPTVWAVDVEAELDDGSTSSLVALDTNRLMNNGLTVSKEGTTVALSGKAIGGYTIT